jgi:hypothetical protein
VASCGGIASFDCATARPGSVRTMTVARTAIGRRLFVMLFYLRPVFHVSRRPVCHPGLYFTQVRISRRPVFHVSPSRSDDGFGRPMNGTVREKADPTASVCLLAKASAGGKRRGFHPTLASRNRSPDAARASVRNDCYRRCRGEDIRPTSPIQDATARRLRPIHSLCGIGNGRLSGRSSIVRFPAGKTSN